MGKRKRDPKQLDLKQCKGFYSLGKRSSTTQKVKRALELGAKPRIDIAYRNNGRIAGHGAYFDHLSLQNITRANTTIANLSDQPSELDNYLRNHASVSLPQTSKISNGVPSCPPEFKKPEDCQGLLYLPGVDRVTKDNLGSPFKKRSEMNTQLIKDALRRGKPILAVCGGSWDLWTHFNGILEDAPDHNCNQGMPRLKENGKVSHNIQVHRIKLTNTSHLLAGALQFEKNKKENPYPAVNSVHWKAASQDFIPPYFEVSALSKSDSALAPKSRQGQTLEPKNDLIEAFESKHGAPILGLQWHPEAYTANTDEAYFPEQQRSLLKYMAESSSSYQAKQALLKSIKNRVSLFQNEASASEGQLDATAHLQLRQTKFLKFDSRAKKRCYHILETRAAQKRSEAYRNEKMANKAASEKPGFIQQS